MLTGGIPLNAELSHKVFDPVTNRWIKPERKPDAPKGQLQKDVAKQSVKDSALKRLEELEKKFIKGTDELLEGLKAAQEIKAKKLYLLVADTWEQYCEERIGRSVRTVRDQLKALQIYIESGTGQQIGKIADSHVDTKGLASKNSDPVMESITPKQAGKAACSPVAKPAKVASVQPTEIKLEITPKGNKAERWNSVLKTLKKPAAQMSEGFLEAIEILLRKWGW